VNGIGSGCELLEIDEPLDTVFLREAFDQTFFMFMNTTAEIVRHAGVKRSVWAAGEDVDVKDTFRARAPQSTLTYRYGSPGQAGR
jgi:hypothetical protein